MDSKCFQYGPISGSQINYDKFLDSALNELGMLSTVTNSRLEYLKEQQEIECLKENMKKKCCTSPLSTTPLCVVYKNSDFVTEFSLSKKPTPATEFKISDDLKTRRGKRLSKSKRRFYAPYYFNRRILPPEKFEEEFQECKSKIPEAPPASPPIISRQDSGNKSNPSSPVKSQNSLTYVGCSIFRSRSLDDLEISKLNLSETPDLLSHVEIDTMSQRISELHVS